MGIPLTNGNKLRWTVHVVLPFFWADIKEPW